MAIPSSRDAKLFYRAAIQRLEDAKYLLDGGRTTAAVYLAGYTIECLLKALILSSVPDSEQAQVMGLFRGQTGHDIDWLKRRYIERARHGLPRDINRMLIRANSWTTAMRYSPGTAKASEAVAFVKMADQIREWADGRMA